MLLKTEIKNFPNSEIEITGEVPAGDFEEQRESAVKNLSKEVKVDGFRPGNIPEKIITDKVGEAAVLEAMAELVMQKAYPKIIEENKIRAIGRPEITITKVARNNPLGFKIKTAILPEIELPDYKNIASEIMKKKEEDVEIEEKEVEQTLDYLRKSRAAKDEEGKESLPELNDDFAKSLGDFENLEALKKRIKENLIEEKKIKQKEKKRAEIVEEIIKSSKTDLPKIIIEAEKDKMINEMRANIEQAGLKWEDYIKNIKKSEEDLRKDWDKEAEKRVMTGLVINEIASKENIEASEEETEKESERILDYYKKFGQASGIDEGRLRVYTRGIIRNEKVFNFLESC